MPKRYERSQSYFEKSINGGFCFACCYLPGYRWEENVGFSDDDIGKHTEYLKSVAHLIFRVAEQRWFENTVESCLKDSSKMSLLPASVPLAVYFIPYRVQSTRKRIDLYLLGYNIYTNALILYPLGYKINADSD